MFQTQILYLNFIKYRFWNNFGCNKRFNFLAFLGNEIIINDI